MKCGIKPVHPGELFLEDVLKPLNMSITEAAGLLGITRKALSEFVNQRSSLSTNLAMRIAQATNTTPESWINMQTSLDLWQARQNAPKVKPFRVPESNAV
jgi:addiction module HigA family antidote